MTSAQPPTAWLLDLLDAINSGPVGRSPRATVRQCPSHPDPSPSLSIGEGSDGRALVHCFAGCGLTDVLAALSLPIAYLWTPPPVPAAAYARAFIVRVSFPPLTTTSGPRNPQNPRNGYRLASVHPYGAEHRLLRYRKGTTKELLWESLRDGSWQPGLFGTRISALPLYREPDIRMAVAAGEPVLLVESESSVDAIVKAGHYSCTWAGGANSVQIGRLTEVVGGYPHLVVIPDNDPPGLACLDTLRAAGLAPNVLMPDPGDDARDLLGQLGRDGFRQLVHQTCVTTRRPA